jgi:PTS system galactitol-specific IIB component
MYKVKILVVCGSGVATSMHVAFKLREYLEERRITAVIDGAGNNELEGRAGNYDIIVSNTVVTAKIEKPVFTAIPLLTGMGEQELVEQIVQAIRKIQAEKG